MVNCTPLSTVYPIVKIKIGLPRDKLDVLIRILVGDHWAFALRGGKIDHRTYDSDRVGPIAAIELHSF